MINDWQSHPTTLPDYEVFVLLEFDVLEYPTNPIVIGKRIKTDLEGEEYEMQFQTLENRKNPINWQPLQGTQ